MARTHSGAEGANEHPFGNDVVLTVHATRGWSVRHAWKKNNRIREGREGCSRFARKEGKDDHHWIDGGSRSLIKSPETDLQTTVWKKPRHHFFVLSPRISWKGRTWSRSGGKEAESVCLDGGEGLPPKERPTRTTNRFYEVGRLTSEGGILS